jgi:hypothetical protein
MNQPNEPFGKMMAHGNGMGVADEAAADVRAKELALSDGRTEVNEKDLLQAREELESLNRTPEAPEIVGDTDEITSWDDVPGESGYQAPTRQQEDATDIGIALVEEGLEEAEHDSRVQASADLEEEIADDEAR